MVSFVDEGGGKGGADETGASDEQDTFGCQRIVSWDLVGLRGFAGMDRWELVGVHLQVMPVEEGEHRIGFVDGVVQVGHQGSERGVDIGGGHAGFQQHPVAVIIGWAGGDPSVDNFSPYMPSWQ